MTPLSTEGVVNRPTVLCSASGTSAEADSMYNRRNKFSREGGQLRAAYSGNTAWWVRCGTRYGNAGVYGGAGSQAPETVCAPGFPIPEYWMRSAKYGAGPREGVSAAPGPANRPACRCRF